MAKFKHTSYTSFVLSANIDGKLKIVEFRDGGNPPFFAHATLTTDDKSLIEYIRNMDEYGKQIIEEEVEEEKEEAPAEDVTVYADVTTVQAAKDILVKSHDTPAARLVNKEAVLSIAAELKVSFPNLSK